ncbi:segregation/condensation protein A [Gammaproteobacteria bacterium]|nr:segregation/condensation protein A [Gammaproteobacteria bacterium]
MSAVRLDADSEYSVLIDGEPLARLPDNLYIPPQALEVFLESFQGPLDLLLYLIRRHKLDILNIPVAEITRQYTEYVELMYAVNLDLAAEYLVMSAILAEVKSRLLLPRPVDEEGEEGEDPRAALIRRLQEYERFRNAAIDLDLRPRLEREHHLATAEFDTRLLDTPPPNVNADMLARALREMMLRAGRQKELHVERETLSIRERMTRILDCLRDKPRLRLEDCFDVEEGRIAVVVSFIALLELTKEGLVQLTQNQPFSPIYCSAYTDESDAE